MKKRKQLLSILLILSMLISCIPGTAFAEDGTDWIWTKMESGYPDEIKPWDENATYVVYKFIPGTTGYYEVYGDFTKTVPEESWDYSIVVNAIHPEYGRDYVNYNTIVSAGGVYDQGKYQLTMVDTNDAHEKYPVEFVAGEEYFVVVEYEGLTLDSVNLKQLDVKNVKIASVPGGRVYERESYGYWKHFGTSENKPTPMTSTQIWSGAVSSSSVFVVEENEGYTFEYMAIGNPKDGYTKVSFWNDTRDGYKEPYMSANQIADGAVLTPIFSGGDFEEQLFFIKPEDAAYDAETNTAAVRWGAPFNGDGVGISGEEPEVVFEGYVGYALSGPEGEWDNDTVVTMQLLPADAVKVIKDAEEVNGAVTAKSDENDCLMTITVSEFGDYFIEGTDPAGVITFNRRIWIEAYEGDQGGEGENPGLKPGRLYAVYDWEVESYDAESGELFLRPDPYIMGEGVGNARTDAAYGDRYTFMEYLEDGSWKLVEDVKISPLNVTDEKLTSRRETSQEGHTYYEIKAYQIGTYQAEAEGRTGMTLTIQSRFPGYGFYLSPELDLDDIIEEHGMPWKSSYGEERSIYAIMDGICGNYEDWDIEVYGNSNLKAEDVEFVKTIETDDRTYYVYEVPLTKSMIGTGFDLEFHDKKEHGDGDCCCFGRGLQIEGAGPEPGKLYAVRDWEVEGYDAESGELILREHPYIMGEGCSKADPRAVEGEWYVFMEYLEDGSWKLVENVKVSPVDVTDDRLEYNKITEEREFAFYEVIPYQIGTYLAEVEDNDEMTMTMYSRFPGYGFYLNPELDLDDIVEGHRMPWKNSYGEERSIYAIMDGLCGNYEDWDIEVHGNSDLKAEDVEFVKTIEADGITYYVYEVPLTKSMIGTDFDLEFHDKKEHGDGDCCCFGRGLQIEGNGPEPGKLYAVYDWAVEDYDEETGLLTLDKHAEVMGEGCRTMETRVVNGDSYVFMEYLEDGSWKLVENVKISPLELTDEDLEVRKDTEERDYPVYRVTPYQIGTYLAEAEDHTGMSLTMVTRYPSFGFYLNPEVTVENLLGYRMPWKSSYGKDMCAYIIMEGLCGTVEDWDIHVEGNAGLTPEDITFVKTLPMGKTTYYVYEVPLSKSMIGSELYVEFCDERAHDGGSCGMSGNLWIEGGGPEPGNLYAVYTGEIRGYDEETGEVTLREHANIMGESCNTCRPDIMNGDSFVFLQYTEDKTWIVAEDVEISAFDVEDKELYFDRWTNNEGITYYNIVPHRIGTYLAEYVNGEGDVLSLYMYSRYPHMSLYTKSEISEASIVGYDVVWKSEYPDVAPFYFITKGMCGEPADWKIQITGSAGLSADDMTYMHEMVYDGETYYVYHIALDKSMTGTNFHIEFTDKSAHDGDDYCNHGYGIRILGAGPEPGKLYAVYDWEVEEYDAETGELILIEDAYIMGEGCNPATPDIGHGDTYVFMEYLADGTWRLVEDVTVNAVGIIDNRLKVEKIPYWHEFPVYNIVPYEECDYWVQEVVTEGNAATEGLSMIMKSEFPSIAFYRNMAISPWDIIGWNYTWMPGMATQDVYLITESLCGAPDDWTINVEGFEDLVAEDFEYKGIVYHGAKQYHAYRVPLDISMLGYEFHISLTDEKMHPDEDWSCSLGTNLCIGAELKISDTKLDLNRPLHELGEELYYNYGIQDGDSLTRYLYMVTYDYSMPEPVIAAVMPFTAASDLNVRFLAEENENGPVWIDENHGLTFTQTQAGENEYIIDFNLSENDAFDESREQGYSVQVGNSGNIWFEIDKPHCEWVFSDVANLDKLDLDVKADRIAAFDAISRSIEIDGRFASKFDKYMYIAYFDTSGEADSSNLIKIEAVVITEDTPWILSHFAGYYDDESEIYNPAENLTVTQKEGNLFTFSYTGNMDEDLVKDWDGDYAYYVEQEGDFGHSWAAYILLKMEGGPQPGRLYAVYEGDVADYDAETGELFLQSEYIMGEDAETCRAAIVHGDWFVFMEFVIDENGGHWMLVDDVTLKPVDVKDSKLEFERYESEKGFAVYRVTPYEEGTYRASATGMDGTYMTLKMSSMYPYMGLYSEPVMRADTLLSNTVGWIREFGESTEVYLITEALHGDPTEWTISAEGEAGIDGDDLTYMHWFVSNDIEYHVYQLTLTKDMIGTSFYLEFTDENCHEDNGRCRNSAEFWIDRADGYQEHVVDSDALILDNDGTQMQYDAQTGDEEAKDVAVTLPAELFGKEEGKIEVKEDSALEINTDIATIEFDAPVLQQIADQTEDVVLTVTEIKEGDKAYDNVQGALQIADRVIDLNLYCGDEKISEFDGKVKVTLAYKLSEASLIAGKLPIVYYVDDAGEKHAIQSEYDKETGLLYFMTDHFSVYTVEDPAAEAMTLRGDVNMDGKVSAEDLTLLAQYYANSAELTEFAQLANADADCNKELTAHDLTSLARYISKIITKLD